MKLVVRPLILEASVTEISPEARSRTGPIFVVSYEELFRAETTEC